MTPNPFDVDVVIIGAGFAGLTVSTILAREGISVVVLEARDRVGGKVEAQLDERGRLVDTGAQFVNDEMTEVLALASLAGARNTNAVHPGRATAVPPQAAGEPWTEAEALLATLGTDHLDDGRMVSEWVAGLAVDGIDVSGAVREAVRSVVNGSTCHESNQIPVSYLAQLNERTPANVEKQQTWFPATLHSLAAHLAAPLGSALRVAVPSAPFTCTRPRSMWWHSTRCGTHARWLLLSHRPRTAHSVSPRRCPTTSLMLRRHSPLAP